MDKCNCQYEVWKYDDYGKFPAVILEHFPFLNQRSFLTQNYG